MKTIYVGNIPFDESEETISSLFEEYGTISSVKFINDRETGKFRGFGFVDMDNDDEATKAINGLNGKPFGSRQRNLVVNEARDKAPRRKF